MKAPPQGESIQTRLVKLGEVLTSIEAGKSFKADQRPASSDEWGVLKISALTWGEFQPQENKALLPDSDPSGIPTVHAGDLMISRANTVELVGAVAMADKDYPHLVLSDKTLRLNPKPQYVDSRYLLYALRRPEARKHIESHATGTSGSMRNITQANIRKIPIILPSLKEQRRIAAILDKADGVRQKRREAIRLTEELLRSQFLEMFGDPATNPKGWEIRVLEDFAEIRSGIAKGKKIDPSKSVSTPYMRVANVQDGHIDLSEIKKIQVLPSDIEKYGLQKGDVLLTEGGDPDKLGRGAVWYNAVQPCIHQNHIFCVRPQNSVTEPEYLSAIIGSQYGKRYFLRAAKQTTGIATINKTQLRKFPALIPPISLQKKYVRLVKHIEKTQGSFGNAKTDLENLFNSLLQRAFRGDL